MITGLDHLVLTVARIDATAAFYCEGLGMELRSFGERGGRKALHFGAHKINLHEQGREFEPKALHPTPGSADLCFLTDEPLDMVAERLKALGHPVIEGPVERTGASGSIVSIYVRDPDGNLIEISRRS
jgi:catechol 2,3-dioxygenase-like lactoylglutathione lyase family enzyme